MIEREFKAMLSKEEYGKLLSLYEWDRVILQTNHYYDTPDLLLSKRHITCRVRVIEGESFLQLKLPAGADYERVELERNIGGSVPDVISGELQNELAKEYRADLPEVRRLGALTTERRVKRLDGAEIDLDKSSYFSKTDYELEIEFTDESTARSLFEEIKNYAGIVAAGDICIGKVRRFLLEYEAKSGQE